MIGLPAEQNQPAPDDLIDIGIFGAPHGVHGEIKLFSLSDVPGRFQNLTSAWWVGKGQECKHLAVAGIRPGSQFWLASFLGMETPETVRVLTGGRLAIPKADRGSLPPGQFFIDDILGLNVLDSRGLALGRVTEVWQTGANDIYEIHGPEGEWLLPALPGVILQIDLARMIMRVKIPAGLEPGARYRAHH